MLVEDSRAGQRYYWGSRISHQQILTGKDAQVLKIIVNLFEMGQYGSMWARIKAGKSHMAQDNPLK